MPVLGFLFFFIAAVLFFILYLLTRMQVKSLTEDIGTINRQYADQRKKLLGFEERFQPIIQVDTELERVMKSLEQARGEEQAILGQLKGLRSELAVLVDEKNFQSVAMYKKSFDFTQSVSYRQALEENERRQKELVKTGKAAICNQSWTVHGDLKEGARITKDLTKLALRAFNGECDAAIAKVTWSNFETMKARIEKSFTVINDFTARWTLFLKEDYLKLKISELILTHELADMEQKEKEEQKELREKVREEERVAREIEKARRDAEIEERRAAEALEKARKELEKAREGDQEKFQMKIAELEARLMEAQSNQQRAISMAQQTKRGVVYIISNIGSFGEGVYKIGMTRRLDPMERVKELGDASVPFTFDVHGMIKSENAPGLEADIHRAFETKRLNLVNDRKEFFRVTLDEIERVCQQKQVEVSFTKIAEAREYRESQALQSAMRRGEAVDVPAAHGSELLDDDG